MINIVTTWNSSLFNNSAEFVLSSEQRYRVLAEADNLDYALLVTLKLRPDLLILDCSSPATASLNLILEVVKMETTSKILLVLTKDLQNQTDDLFQWLADAAIFKADRPAHVLETVEGLFKEVLWQKAVIGPTLKHPIGNKLTPSTKLNRRELEVLSLVAKGHTNQTIAEELSISKKTVEYHINKLLTKLEANNRAETVSVAYTMGIFPSGSLQ